jgi:hypothetical protein
MKKQTQGWLGVRLGYVWLVRFEENFFDKVICDRSSFSGLVEFGTTSPEKKSWNPECFPGKRAI